MNLYDFDKTIYRHDSPTQFYFYVLKRKPYLFWHLFVVLYYRILKLLNIIDMRRYAEKLYSVAKYLKNLDSFVCSFWDIEERNINAWYYEKRQEDDVICSATPSFILNEIKKRINNSATLICSNYDLKTCRYHNKKSDRCSGKEKVSRLKELNFTNFENGYSDSKTDIPMLSLCKNKFLVKNGIISEFDKSYFNDKK